jgi:hypothetical protein
MMFRLWRWTYARTYIQQERWWGQKNDPSAAAAAGTSMVIAFNILAGWVALSSVLGLDLALGANKFEIVGAALLLWFIVYRRYVLQGGARAMIRRMRRQNRAKTGREERKLWSYIITSLALPMVLMVASAYLRTKFDHGR